MTDETQESEAPGSAVAVADPDAAGALVPSAGTVEVAHPDSGHPTTFQYVMIAVILVVVTAFEIALSYVDTGHTNFVIWALFAMAFVKFFLVAAWYMHMKLDQPFFRRIFVVGMVGAGIVYGIVMLVFSSTVLKS